jgi:hypothetical protein
MSLVLIALSVVLVVGVYVRLVVRARAIVRTWARDYGYRVVSASFESAFSSTDDDSGRSAEVVYRVALESGSGTVRTGRLLMWNVLLGRPTALIRWDHGSPDRAGP